MAGAGAEECPHALLVPFSGLGHVSAFMLLARALAALGFKITYVYYSSFYAKLKANGRLVLPYLSHMSDGHNPSSQYGSTDGSTASKAPAGDSSSHPATPTINNGNGLIEIRVVDDGFAPGDINKLFFSTPTMAENLCNLILELREQGTPPTCLVSDSFVPWSVHVAKRAGIPRIDFWTSSALAYITSINLPLLYSQGIFPEKGSSTQWKCEAPLMLDHIPGLPPFSSELYPPELRFTGLSHPIVAFFNEVSSCSKYGERVFIHTMADIEVDAFRAFQAAGMPAYGIGPLLHYTGKPQEDTIPASSSPQVDSSIAWLNTQADSSVIYIAFGSFASFSIEEIHELAFGLEASGSPFLWAIREDLVRGAETTQVLPKGFKERTGERGLITGWAPQVEVLAHRAIGGFLTHCGWNSVLESLWEGVPMLCCPRLADHRLDSHYLCNVWGVGLELERTDTGGLERRFVELGVKALMQEEEGIKARSKAREMMPLTRNACKPGGQSFNNLQKFYDDMKVLCISSK